MKSFEFAVNAVMPLIIMVALGYVLKRIGLIKPDFARAANKLVFRVLLPALLFLNVYKIESVGDISINYVIYALISVLLIFLIVAPLTAVFTDKRERRGVLLQASFRSNFALVGVALALALFGDKGVGAAALLSSVAIPTYNILAVVALSVFSGGGEKPSVKKMLLAIVKNPLIIATLLGLLCVIVRAPLGAFGVGFRLSDIKIVYKVLEYLSDASTPITLLVLGAQFEFYEIGEMKREIIIGTAIRVLIVPVLGLGIAYIFFREIFAPEQFAALIALFATPVAVSTVPMVQEMGGDRALASQLVVWTTILSGVTLVGASFFFKAVGIF